MSTRFRSNRILWFVLGFLALGAAGVGVFAPRIYDGLVAPAIEPGVFTQDIVVLVGALLLILLAMSTREHQYRRRAVAHGLMGFLFYAYGIYTIERIYSVLYPVYLFILALSFYLLVYDVATSRPGRAGVVQVAKPVRIVSAIYAIVIAVMFNVIWLSQLVPLIAARERIDSLYSIYVIDLSFIMPAFLIVAVSALRNRLLGLMGLPSMFVLGAGILSPLAIAEVLKPSRYGLDFNPGEFWLYLVLTVLFLLFAGIYLALARDGTPVGSDQADPA